MDQETELALLKQEVEFLKVQVGAIQTDVREKFDRLEQKLDEALKGRPTWAMALLLGGLMTICTSLVVLILTRG